MDKFDELIYFIESGRGKYHSEEETALFDWAVAEIREGWKYMQRYSNVMDTMNVDYEDMFPEDEEEEEEEEEEDEN